MSMNIWDVLFRIAFIGLCISIGCIILFIALKNSVYRRMFIKIAAGMLALCIGSVMMERSWNKEPAVPAASTQATESQPSGIESYVQMLNDAIPFENCTIEVDDGVVYIGIFDDDIVETAKMAMDGNAAAQESWKEVLNGFVEMTDGLQEGLTSTGYGEYSIAVMLLADENQEDVLAIIQNGAIVYDCTEE